MVHPLIDRSVRRSTIFIWKFWKVIFPAIRLDRDLGFSRRHQYDDDNDDEDEDEEVKEDNDDNEEDKEDNKEEANDQIIKCSSFLESQDRELGFLRGPQYDDDNENGNEDEEVKEDIDDNEEDMEDNKEEDNDQIIKCHTFLESHAQADLNDDNFTQSHVVLHKLAQNHTDSLKLAQICTIPRSFVQSWVVSHRFLQSRIVLCKFAQIREINPNKPK